MWDYQWWYSAVMTACTLSLVWHLFAHRQRVPFYESMTRRRVVTVDGGVWDVRVWRRSETPTQGADPLIWAILSPDIAPWQSVEQLQQGLRIGGVAAFEILDPQGNGSVTYLEWNCRHWLGKRDEPKAQGECRRYRVV